MQRLITILLMQTEGRARHGSSTYCRTIVSRAFEKLWSCDLACYSLRVVSKIYLKTLYSGETISSDQYHKENEPVLNEFESVVDSDYS